MNSDKQIPEYSVWATMRNRCNNPNNKDYARYGGRGIGVCKEWSDFGNFLEDMGSRPSAQHTLDRVDNDRDYSRDNCRWATRKEQANNTSRIRLITINGETKSVRDWQRQYGIISSTLCHRINAQGMTEIQALTKPLGTTSYRVHQ